MTKLYNKFGATDLFMLLAVLLWAVNFSVIKVALREFTPLGFNGIRLFFASTVLLVILFLSGEDFSLGKRDIWKLGLLGFTGNTIFQLLFIHGINLTTASNASIIIAMGPIFIALLSSLMKHERLNVTAWAGILISLAGFDLIITKQTGSIHMTWHNLRGDLMILSCDLLWAFYTVFSKPMLKKTSPLKLTAFTMLAGTLFFIPFSIKDVLSISYSSISLKAWVSLFYSGFFSLAVCYLIWYSSVRRVGNSRTAIYDNLVPVFAVLIAYIFLGERLSFLQGTGMLVIFIGIYLTRSANPRFGSKVKADI